MTTSNTTDTPVRFDERGQLGLITLNRPRAINALSRDMIVAVHERLDAWARDERIRTVAIRGAGERGLCAGGDVAALARAALDGSPEAAVISRDFFDAEYRLNAAIARYPKPYVALMDGYVLGGGVGVSAHGSHRVVTERSKVGMPETGIGLYPDVGAAWLFARGPAGVGLLMGLTGTPVGPGDALYAGFADAFVSSDRLDALLTALESTSADAAVARARSDAPGAPFAGAAEAAWLAALDVAPTLETALEVLREAGVAADSGGATGLAGAVSEIAAQALATIETRSPSALRLTFEAIRRARGYASVEEALRVDYRLARRVTQRHDFIEGVRAQLIDKDRSPTWSPSTLAEVADADIEAAFAPFSDGDELRLPGDELAA